MINAILLLTNRTDYAVRDRYDKLVREYGENADVFLFLDNSASIDNRDLNYFERVYTFSLPQLISEGYAALENGFFGNCHYPLLKFHKDYPDYDYYWVIENDVKFFGDWSFFFDTFVDDDSDLVAARVRRYIDDSDWFWWKSVKAPEGIGLSTTELYASFNPVYRLSAQALECLEVEMSIGWRGHFEAIVPTVLAKHGMKIRDIKEFYTEETHTWPTLHVQPMKPNMIYHPVKEKISKRSYRKNCLLSIVGEHSYHKAWIYGDVERVYDVHLVVYDLSFGKHYNDADFVYGKAGRRAVLIKDYFDNHDYLLDQYDYFFIIDEMSTMTAVQINNLFNEMDKEKSEFSLVGTTMPCLRQDLMKLLLSDNPENSILFF